MKIDLLRLNLSNPT